LNTKQVKQDANTGLILREFDSNTIYPHLNKMRRINRRRTAFGGLRSDSDGGG
jgi:hypothetical protein